MIDAVLNQIRQAGGTIEVVGDDLRLRVPKGLLSSVERLLLAEHKAEIVTLLAVEAVVETPVEITTTTTVEAVVNSMIEADFDQEFEEIVPPPPCRQCGSLELWQDFSGSWHCQHCQAEGLQRSERLVEQAARLRRQGRKSGG